MKARFVAFVFLFASVLNTAQAQGERVFKEWDKNGDGVLVKDEVPEGPRRIFDKKDANGDGKITLAEHLGKMKPGPDRGKGEPENKPTEEAAFTIRQKWGQEPNGFDRPVYVAEPTAGIDDFPVLIYFHGGGGNAARSLRKWAGSFPDHLVVAPQGYERGWNVQGEKSKAPDVTFFKR